jgi:hypothetical protein
MVREWRRRLLGGLGVSLIVPGLVVASLVVLALAGGFGGLTALGQALSGPVAPTSALAGGHGGPIGHPLPAKLVAALSQVPPVSSFQSGGAAAPAGDGPAGTGTTVAPGPHGSSGPPARHHPGQTPSGGPSPAARPTPKPQPTLTDKVASAGAAATSQLPAPVGPAATKTLQTAASTLDSIAPIKSP